MAALIALRVLINWDRISVTIVCHNRTRDTVYSIIQIAAILPLIHRATREPRLAFARVLSSTHMR